MIYNFTPLANRNRQFSAFYLILSSIVGCIVAYVALFLNKNKKSFRKYPDFNSTFTLNTGIFILRKNFRGKKYGRTCVRRCVKAVSKIACNKKGGSGM
jgi:hypothetical protein